MTYTRETHAQYGSRVEYVPCCILHVEAHPAILPSALHTKLKFSPKREMYNITKLPDLVIPDGSSDSQIVKAAEVYNDAYDLGFISGVTTGDIQVSNDGVTFTKLKALTASTAEVIMIPFLFFRIHLAAAASGADVHISLSKRWDA